MVVGKLPTENPLASYQRKIRWDIVFLFKQQAPNPLLIRCNITIGIGKNLATRILVTVFSVGNSVGSSF